MGFAGSFERTVTAPTAPGLRISKRSPYVSMAFWMPPQLSSRWMTRQFVLIFVVEVKK